jgi:hypothetical protein
MPNQDAIVSMPHEWFKGFTAAIVKFNKRTEKVNAGLKKAKYQKVNRFPISHSSDTVTIRVAIKDRSKVLWQELSDILDHFRDHNMDLAGRMKKVAVPEVVDLQPVAHDWVAAGEGKCKCLQCLKDRLTKAANMTESAVAASESMSAKPPATPPPWMKPCAAPAKAISLPVQPRSATKWGLWVPCADEAAARQLQAVFAHYVKVETPSVECRG